MNLPRRYQVFSLYRQFWKTQRRIFDGDVRMQEEAKKRIRLEFRSNLTETNTEKIDSLLSKGIENLNFLKKNVIQGVQSEKTGAYSLKINPETERNDDLKGLKARFK